MGCNVYMSIYFWPHAVQRKEFCIFNNITDVCVCVCVCVWLFLVGLSLIHTDLLYSNFRFNLNDKLLLHPHH